MSEKEIPRLLKEDEIEYILDFIKPNQRIPKESADLIVRNIRNQILPDLKSKKFYVSKIDVLKKHLHEQFKKSLSQPGTCVGIITAQSIGEKQTQSNLNSFHKAGSADKQPVVSKFAELLNITNKPKVPSYIVHLAQGNSTIAEVRKTIGSNLVQLTMKNFCESIKIHLDKEDETWYDFYHDIYGIQPTYRDCIVVKINMPVLYEYKIRLVDLCQAFSKFTDIQCIPSPDCFSEIHLFVDTSNITLPDSLGSLAFVNEGNIREIYLEEIVIPTLENQILFGIPGIGAIFFVKDDKVPKCSVCKKINAEYCAPDEKIATHCVECKTAGMIENMKWYIETENLKERPNICKYKGIKEKQLSSDVKFRMLLSKDFVDMSRCYSNNVWDMYKIFGIEATREYMIREFMKIMEGINICHIQVLVDKMTFGGYPTSITRYAMRDDKLSVLSRSAFEESIEHLASACVFGQKDAVNSISASIICGKEVNIGTGMDEYAVDVSKLVGK